MPLDRVKERLLFANDQCPLPNSPIPSLHHTHWYAKIRNRPSSITSQPDGYTVTVFKSRFISWYRTFSVSEPLSPPSTALITIQEWLPRYEVKPGSKWITFGQSYTAAYAKLHANYQYDWRKHTRRHLRSFQAAGYSLRLGKLTDVEQLYRTSQIPKVVQTSLLRRLIEQLSVHPKSTDILTAEKNGQLAACLVAGYCHEAKLSEYIIGAFHPDFKNSYAMIGLVNWWYQRALEQGCETVTFGHMEPPGVRTPLSGAGYSFFKTHFGVERIWFPKNRWRFFFNHRVLFSKWRA